MTDSESKALQAKEKAAVPGPAEQLKPGLVFSPAIDIFETEKEITLLAHARGEAESSEHRLEGECAEPWR